MFGRFPGQESLAREYLLIPGGAGLKDGYEEVTATPLEAREVITEAVLYKHNQGRNDSYAIYELVEFVTVDDVGDDSVQVWFSEDEMNEDGED